MKIANTGYSGVHGQRWRLKSLLGIAVATALTACGDPPVGESANSLDQSSRINRLSTSAPAVKVANRPAQAPKLGAALTAGNALDASATDENLAYPNSPWLDSKGISPNGWYMLDVIATAQVDGVDPERLHNTNLDKLLAQRWSPENAHAIHSLLTSAFKLMIVELTTGRVDPKTAQASWFDKPQKVDIEALYSSLDTNSAGARGVFNALKSHWQPHQPLIKTIASYRTLAAQGGWGTIDKGPTMERGDSGPRITQLANRLRNSGEHNNNTTATASFDPALEESVIAFQKRHGLKADGIVGPSTLRELNTSVESRIEQLTVNLERLRWMPADLGTRHLITNIPDYRMKVINGNNVDIDMPVVIGKKKHKTPVFTAEMNHIVVNPTWLVPRSITNNELVPKERTNPGHLASSGFEILKGNGSKPVNPNHLPVDAWYQSPFPYKIRQKSGNRNALGKVKFMLPNPYSIYLHDTQAKKLFSKEKRAFSHGCVRLSRPRELADYLLALKGWSPQDVDKVFKSQRTKTIKLDEPLPNHIVYLTAWVESDGTVNFRQDIYGQDKRLLVALNKEQEKRERLIKNYSRVESLLAQID